MGVGDSKRYGSEGGMDPNKKKKGYGSVYKKIGIVLRKTSLSVASDGRIGL